MKKYFVDQFDSYAICGDTITCTIGDTTYNATIHHDTDCGIDDDDTHNIDQSVTGCNDKQQAKLLAARDSFNSDWYYCGIVISAERDGWKKDNMDSLWGIECNYPDSKNEHLSYVANELLEELLA